MRPILEHLILDSKESFRLRKATHPAFFTPWHYHPEYEIILIIKSTGTRFVGDHIDSFAPGDLVFMGPSLPHVWKNDSCYLDADTNLIAQVLVIHFSTGFFDAHFGNLPEMVGVKSLFEKAKRGLKFYGDSAIELGKKIKTIDEHKGSKRLLLFMELLINMGESHETKELSSVGFINSYQSELENRMVTVYDYIMNNFTRSIKLKTVSEIANMAPTSFCRYFKTRTGKTYVQFLNEIRLGYVRKLLMEKDYSIQMAAMEAGYKNLSNFNTQFKKYTGETPSIYMKKQMKK